MRPTIRSSGYSSGHAAHEPRPILGSSHVHVEVRHQVAKPLSPPNSQHVQIAVAWMRERVLIPRDGVIRAAVHALYRRRPSDGSILHKQKVLHDYARCVMGYNTKHVLEDLIMWYVKRGLEVWQEEEREWLVLKLERTHGNTVAARELYTDLMQKYRDGHNWARRFVDDAYKTIYEQLKIKAVGGRQQSQPGPKNHVAVVASVAAVATCQVMIIAKSRDGNPLCNSNVQIIAVEKPSEHRSHVHRNWKTRGESFSHRPKRLQRNRRQSF